MAAFLPITARGRQTRSRARSAPIRAKALPQPRDQSARQNPLKTPLSSSHPCSPCISPASQLARLYLRKVVKRRPVALRQRDVTVPGRQRAPRSRSSGVRPNCQVEHKMTTQAQMDVLATEIINSLGAVSRSTIRCALLTLDLPANCYTCYKQTSTDRML